MRARAAAARGPLAAVATAVLAVLLVVVLRGAAAGLDPHDFHAFFCAGAAANAGADPYRTEPLRSCEAALALDASSFPSAVALPVPLPGYDVALFRLLALLGAPTAVAIDVLLAIVATAVVVVVTARLTGAPRAWTLVVYLVGTTYIALLMGQLAIFAVAFAVTAAEALGAGAPRRAGALALGTLIEPHLGLPVVLALALFAPRTRPALGLGLLALAAVSLVALPFAQDLEYLRDVLPAHVRAEAPAHEQLSLTNLLYVAHVPAEVAIRLGSLSYLATALFALAVLRRRRVDARDPLIVLVPFALAPVFGAFVHVTQICAAIPLLVAAARRDPARAALPALGLALLGFPWIQIVGDATTFATAGFAALLGYAATGGIARLRPAVAGVAALATGALELALHAIGTPHAYDGPALAHALRGAGATSLAETSWAAFVLVSWTRGTPEFLAARAPTWIGELALLVVVARLASTSRAKTTTESDRSLSAA